MYTKLREKGAGPKSRMGANLGYRTVYIIKTEFTTKNHLGNFFFLNTHLQTYTRPSESGSAEWGTRSLHF